MKSQHSLIKSLKTFSSPGDLNMIYGIEANAIIASKSIIK